jgi:hypothetical protein
MSVKFLHYLLLYLNEKFQNNEISWVFYGSVATSTMNENSDIDVFMINDASNCPTRLSDEFMNYPITIYSVSMRDIILDGEEKKYGGFFICKLLCGYIIFGSNKLKLKIEIQRLLGEYFKDCIGSISIKKNNINPDNILADCFKTYLDFFPHFDKYILKLYTSNNFGKIWQDLKLEIFNSLLLVNAISLDSYGNVAYKQTHYEEYNKLKTKVIARFWVFASLLHNDIEFPDYYFSNCERFIKDNEEKYNNMICFLTNMQEYGN